MQNKLKNSLLVITVLAIASALGATASAQTTKSAIQSMTGWQHCAACAGAGGNGPSASTTMVRGISSPSLSGAASQFTISSGTPYADVLWWKQLGAANTASNLLYDLYFYVKTPQYAQALEFDANQANGNHRWIFGTQCNIGAGHWDIWANAAGKWTTTGIPCSMPKAYTWHHLTWEFKRNSTQVTFVAFTYDGVKHYVNRTYPVHSSSVNELNVAVQMDQRSNHVTFSEWIDNVSLKYW